MSTKYMCIQEGLLNLITSKGGNNYSFSSSFSIIDRLYRILPPIFKGRR